MVNIEVYLVAGELITGLWCQRCLKPSGYEQCFYMLWATGVTNGNKLRTCYDCGVRIPEESTE